MKKLRFTLIFLLVLGCAQFNGMESESKQGLIPEILRINSSEEETKDILKAEQQAQLHTSRTRALYLESQMKSLPENSPLRKAYSQQAQEAKETARRLSDTITQ